MAGNRTCEYYAMLSPLYLGSWDDVWCYIFEKRRLSFR